MKPKYKWMLYLLAAEFFLLIMLNKSGMRVESWVGSAIGILITILPIQILLFMLSRDENISQNKRMCFKVAFWFVIICYCLGGAAMLLLE